MKGLYNLGNNVRSYAAAAVLAASTLVGCATMQPAGNNAAENAPAEPTPVVSIFDKEQDAYNALKFNSDRVQHIHNLVKGEGFAAGDDTIEAVTADDRVSYVGDNNELSRLEQYGKRLDTIIDKDDYQPAKDLKERLDAAVDAVYNSTEHHTAYVIVQLKDNDEWIGVNSDNLLEVENNHSLETIANAAGRTVDELRDNAYFGNKTEWVNEDRQYTAEEQQTLLNGAVRVRDAPDNAKWNAVVGLLPDGNVKNELSAWITNGRVQYVGVITTYDGGDNDYIATPEALRDRD